MAAETVNAYYSAELNEMVFPAGILKRPFYDAKFPEWVIGIPTFGVERIFIRT